MTPEIIKASACVECPLKCSSKKFRVILREKEKSSGDSCMDSREKIVALFGIPFVN